MVCDNHFIVITENILPLGQRHSHRYPEDRYTGVLPYTFTITLAGQTNVDRNMGNIVIPGFCPIHFTITLAGQMNVERHTEDR